VSKRKRTRKQPSKSTAASSKKGPQKNTLIERIKANWPIWAVSVLMACSLVGRFAGSSARQAARARSSQPASTATAAPAQSVADQATFQEEDFSGNLAIQGEDRPSDEVSYSLRLPADWHDKIKTSIQDNIVSFSYNLDTVTQIPLFTLAAYTDSAWEILQAGSDPHGEKLSETDGVVVVDEIILDQAAVDRTPALKAVKDQLPQILHSFAAKPTS
jgi:hypothetical protein